jgi:hypothetical protein
MKPGRRRFPGAGACSALLAAAIWQIACGAGSPPAAPAENAVSSRYSTAPLDALLERHVHGGLVDYGALRRDPGLASCVKGLEDADLGQLSGRSEKLAFWINAYNLLALKEVADTYPLRSIRDIGGQGRLTFFRGIHFHVGGRDCTLDTIEHKILRPGFHEPRIHFALVSASMGSPRLRSAAFHADTLEAELQEAAREFISDPARVSLDRVQGVLHLSPIFEWSGEDFDRSAGNRLDYVRRYLPPSDAEFLSRGGVTIHYLDYDWDLNDRRAVGAVPAGAPSPG